MRSILALYGLYHELAKLLDLANGNLLPIHTTHTGGHIVCDDRGSGCLPLTPASCPDLAGKIVTASR